MSENEKIQAQQDEQELLQFIAEHHDAEHVQHWLDAITDCAD